MMLKSAAEEQQEAECLPLFEGELDSVGLPRSTRFDPPITSLTESNVAYKLRPILTLISHPLLTKPPSTKQGGLVYD